VGGEGEIIPWGVRGKLFHEGERRYLAWGVRGELFHGV